MTTYKTKLKTLYNSNKLIGEIAKPVYSRLLYTLPLSQSKDKSLKIFNIPKKTLSMLIALYALMGCSPTVKIEPPDKPIVINLNVKIEHEIKIKVDKELDELLADDELF